MSESKHTPTPWVASSSILICATDARVVANCTPVNVPDLAVPLPAAAANAAFIVRAVNAHDELVAALERLVAQGEPIVGTPSHARLVAVGVDAIDRARAALRKARGES